MCLVLDIVKRWLSSSSRFTIDLFLYMKNISPRSSTIHIPRYIPKLFGEGIFKISTISYFFSYYSSFWELDQDWSTSLKHYRNYEEYPWPSLVFLLALQKIKQSSINIRWKIFWSLLETLVPILFRNIWHKMNTIDHVIQCK